MTQPLVKRPVLSFLAWGLFILGPFCSAEGVVLHMGWSLEGSASAAAREPAFDGIGWVETHEGANRFRGTGVLVAPNWVLTVAHNWLADAVTALTFHHGGAAYEAVTHSWYQHPSWVSAPAVGLGQGWDIALIELSLPVVSAVPASIYSGNAELGANVLFAGYGFAGTADVGPRANPTPTLYGAANTIDRIVSLTGSDGEGGLLAMDFDDGTTMRNSLAHAGAYDIFGRPVDTISGGSISGHSSDMGGSRFEGTSARGDSGAPVFADFGSGYEVIGLATWGVNPTSPRDLYGSGYGDVTYLTRVSVLNDWISSTMSIPEPRVLGLLLAGAVTLAYRRVRPVHRRAPAD